MAESFAQRRRNVVAALRRVRQSYRKADSAGEKLERELDRLIDRKTIVSPASMENAVKAYEAYFTAVNGIDQPFTDAIRLSSSYV